MKHNAIPYPTFADYWLGFAGCSLITLALLPFFPIIHHWFLLPLIACSGIVGGDCISWFRGRYELFDPKAIISALGIHFFWLAPILIVIWDYRITWVANVLQDYRPWLGFMAIINFFGLICYRIGARFAEKHSVGSKIVYDFSVQGNYLLTLILFVSAGSYLFVLYKQGGYSTLLSQQGGQRQIISGLGLFKMIGRAFPLLLLIMITRQRLMRQKLPAQRKTIIALIIILALLLLFIVGLRGSRSRTVWGIFYVTAIIHFFWRKLSIKWVLPGLAVLFLFFYFYGFYKRLGRETIEQLNQGTTINELALRTNMTKERMFISDLSRADIQAYILYILTEKPHPYRYRYGRTYILHLLAKCPRWLWPNRFNTGLTEKAVAGYHLQFGNDQPEQASSRVYGLAGEVMLNFGIFAVPPAFLLWGIVVGRCRKALYFWKAGDVRFFLLPLWINFAIILLSSDSDNWLYFLMMNVLFPLCVIFTISKRKVQA